MKRTLSIAVAGAAMAAAAPAYAALTPTTLACNSATDLSVAASDCRGYYDGNVNGLPDDPSNQPEYNDVLGVLSSLLGTTVTSYHIIENLGDLSTNNPNSEIDFSALLQGKVVIGIHKGKAGRTGVEGTAFYLFNNLSPTDKLTFNLQGLSNAQLYLNGGAVPEPATWMLMIAGVGMVGFAMRRKQQAKVKFNFA